MKLDLSYLQWFVSQQEINQKSSQAISIKKDLFEKNIFSQYLWWIDLPETSQNDLDDILESANFFRQNLQKVVIIWIWWSFLWAKAVIELQKKHFKKDSLEIIFAWTDLDWDYLSELLEYLDNEKFWIVCISKSWTTTEPAIAFRLLRQKLIENVWLENHKNFIISVTDEKKWALLNLSKQNWYKTFPIKDDIWWRYSVLSPVWLLPIALAWIDIKELVLWAYDFYKKTKNISFEDDDVLKYAIIRNILLEKWKNIEILVWYKNNLRYFQAWWQQLFSESEWKNWKWIFTSSSIFTTDLHSLGQYIQDWQKIFFETTINFLNNKKDVIIWFDEQNLDELNYLNQKDLCFVNQMAMKWTIMAHSDWWVPNIVLDIDENSWYCIWELIYFFELSCAISGCILWENPFNQPWVEKYKKNMFELLWK